MSMIPSYFLSASIPYGDRAIQYIADPLAVREAVRGLVATVIGSSQLVFGGHPAITPFVWEIAKALNAEKNVYIYQSKLFERDFPREVRWFDNLIMTDIDRREDKSQTKDASLELMRRQMIADHKFFAAFFIGGMNGTEDEWNLFGRTHPGVPRFPVASTEGAAAILWNEEYKRERHFPPKQQYDLVDALASELNYRKLFHYLVQRPISFGKDSTSQESLLLPPRTSPCNFLNFGIKDCHDFDYGENQ